ncbi:MAG: hypothetical protein K6G68_10480 [Oscillospiraceae bacterium]|nr:hypothetical protein [Oscillospiraceae bacterium]
MTGVEEMTNYDIGCDVPPKKEINFKKINTWILFLNLVFPLWFFTWIYAVGISDTLFMIMAGCCLSLGVVYKIVRKIGKGKRILTVARCIAFLSIMLYYAPVVLLMGFKQTRPVYELKRWVYLNSNFSAPEEFYGKFLPEKLPSECRDYFFSTQGSVIAQDYHPSSVLMFHTDKAAIDSYAAYYMSLDNVQLKIDEEAQSDIEWMEGFTKMRKHFSYDVSSCELYYYKSRFPVVVLLVRQTGLVVIFT